MNSYVYVRSEPGLWTVGFYDPDGKWHPDSDYNSTEEAAKRVNWLNGGNLARELDILCARVQGLEKRLRRTSDIASCLANGIQPD